MDEKERSFLVVFLDSFAALFFIFPAACFYWRGSWDIIDAYVLPNDEPLNHWVRSAIGACTSINYFLLPFIKTFLDRRSNAGYLIGSRMFMIFHGMLYMFLWRGLWGAADYYIGPKAEWGWLGLVVSIALLIAFGTCRQLMWPPYIAPNDDRPELLVVSNRFEVEPERRCKYFLDCLFTSVGLNGLAIFAWRSAWALQTAYIYPDDLMKSDMFCVISGALGVLLFFSFQSQLAAVSRWFEKKYPQRKIYRIIYEDFIYVFIFVTLVLLWRGCWDMNARYVFSDPRVGGPVNHVLGLVALLLLRTMSIISCCGCIRDGAETEGRAFFPTQYLYIYTHPNLFAKERYLENEECNVNIINKDTKPKKVDEDNNGYESSQHPVYSISQALEKNMEE